MTQRARRGGSWIREHRLAGRDTFLVHALEAAERHVYLAADLHDEREARSPDAERDTANRAQIRCHILADGAISASCAGNQNALAVSKTDGDPVDLQLAVVAGPADVVASDSD